jgi:hypothetical protein
MRIKDRNLAAAMTQMQLNIFAMDPVPGALYSGQMHYYQNTTVPLNVRSFWAIYAEHEAGGGMKPLIHTQIGRDMKRVLVRMARSFTTPCAS